MSKVLLQRDGDPSLRSVLDSFVAHYQQTPDNLKVLDLFCACALATAVLQFLYAFLVGSFPFNGFLAGFFCCIGSFVLTLGLRMQLSENSSKSQQQSFISYTLAMTALFLAVWNYIG